MPTKETTRPGIAVWQAAVEKLDSLKADEAKIPDQMAQEVIIGNDVSALQARRVALRSQIEAAKEAVKALRPFAAIEEQAILRRDLDAARQVRVENQQRAREEQARYDELSHELDETAKRVDHWKYRAHDGVFTATVQLDRHIAEHGDLSGESQ